MKQFLRKAIGKFCLTSDQLHIIIKESEAIINLRPLVYVDDDIYPDSVHTIHTFYS